MTAADLVNPAPPMAMVNYPITIGVSLNVGLAILLLYVAGKFDPTHGVLTISIMIVLGMLGAVGYCLIFTIPQDDITPGVVGGLTAGFGAVIAYWLGHRQNGHNGERLPPEPPKDPPEGS